MKRTAIIAALIGAAALTLVWQGLTLARLLSRAEPITNEFKAPEYTLEVIEEFDGTVKENVCVQIIGDLEQCVRIQLLASVQDEEGNTLAVPISLDDFTIEGFDETAWMHVGAYHYYKTPVQPEAVIPIFTRATVKTQFAEGRIPVLIVSAQGIQTNAAQRVWGVEIADHVPTQGG